jgi:hypothetical protein
MLFSLELEEHVLVPLDYQHLTTRAYLASLSNDALVQVPSTVSVAHGLSGRTSNHALKKQQATFKVWIMADRSPTGRTKDSSGRFHGAEKGEPNMVHSNFHGSVKLGVANGSRGYVFAW